MTPEEIVTDALNNGPMTIGDLAGRIFATGVDQKEAYRLAYIEVHALIKCKKIIKHQIGCYMLWPSTEIEKDETEATPKLRPGTSLPKRFAHLSFAGRIAPVVR